METRLEQILTHTHKADMILYIKNHPKAFEETIKLAISERQPYSWRASWLLWSCMKKNDKRIRKYVGHIIRVLPQRHDNQQRELFKVLHLMEIGEKYEGLLFDHCVSVWEKIDKQPSVRMNAFKMIVIITKKHPELVKEVISLTQDQFMETLSPGVRKSIYLMIKKFE